MNVLKAIAQKIKNLFRRSGSGISKGVAKAPGAAGLLDSLKSKEIRKKVMFTLGMVALYRILAAVPLPGIDVSLFQEIFGNNPANNLFTILTGGRLDNPSVVAIGLGAYINASIILQLLQTVIPKLEELSKEGERGRRTINQYTRLLAVPLSLVQAFVIYTILTSVAEQTPSLAGLVSDITTFDIVTMVAALTAGSIVLMWIGELISEYGIGNGISIIITISILSSLPGLFANDFTFIQNDLSLLARGNFNVLLNETMVFIYLFIIGLFLLIAGIVYVTEAIRKIPIQYARRIRGAQGAQESYLPLKINQAGVIPVIFASALLTLPQIASQFLLSASDPTSFIYKAGAWINESFLVQSQTATAVTADLYYYQLAYFLMIVGFTFFYTFITYKPSETAENLQKSGGFIPGLRPGKSTQDFVTKVLLRLTVVGAIFLGLIALLPNLLRYTQFGANLNVLAGIGGTSLLIIVGVVLDTMRQMQSLTVTRSYDQYK